MRDRNEPSSPDVTGHAAALGAAAERLRESFGESFSDESIDKVLHNSYELVASDATVESFLPLPAERRAAGSLRDARNPGRNDTA